MNDLPLLKQYLYSSLTTFITVFVSILAVQLQAGIVWDNTFWFAVGTTAARAAIKAVIESIVKQRIATGKPV